MSFRQDKQRRLDRARWVRRNRETLVAAEVYEDSRLWDHFLWEGYVPLPNGPTFDLEMLRPDQWRRLLAFLEEECAGLDSSPSTLRVLRRLLGLPLPVLLPAARSREHDVSGGPA
jgi:hypothetical protein